MEENQELDTEKEKRVYEASFLLLPSLVDEKLLQTFAAIKETLSGAGAVMISDGFPKPRPLAYPINKFESAFFGWLKFESASEALVILREFLKNNKEVIRFLIIKTVRENAVVTPVFFGKIRPRAEKDGAKEETPASLKMTNEELDKTIEELVVE
ncbi:MAG: 30S ribosomal protein S6 [Candidatus Paceibacterota bacterium]|jgi:small subunit ribosomal protein S6